MDYWNRFTMPCSPMNLLSVDSERVSQQAIPVAYGTIRIDIGFRAGLIVEDRAIVEISRSRSSRRFTKNNFTSNLSAAGRQAAWPADQLQRGADQGRHHPYRQWTGRRISRKVARTPRTRGKLRVPRLAGLRFKTSLVLSRRRPRPANARTRPGFRTDDPSLR